jgi:hypothetical protein
LFKLIRGAPDTLRYEHQLIVAQNDYVIVHGRFTGYGRPVAWIAADVVRIEDGRLAEPLAKSTPFVTERTRFAHAK